MAWDIYLVRLLTGRFINGTTADDQIPAGTRVTNPALCTGKTVVTEVMKF